ncbi:OmpA family protein [Photobacterium sp. OFAV2-7]|uniref:OmpA family protein n=1 Tax=Photobacterium sp. OFAV2-7 TaxID=2917748 RepID=UPI001EF66837|nr:OmpA family protein [Photobacterium sp. OFAV2-7]MCG7586698.1 OmpA family protein [Photobacterium sp. OFAV2-7]
MSCKKQCYLLIPFLLTGIFLSGCGNGGDTVTNSQGQQSTSPSPSVVPSARILLTELPEMRQTVYFEKDSYELDATNQRDLDPIAVRLRQHPDSFIVVVGHSDDSGNEEENIVLSYERAFSVAIYISSVFGVEEERIQIVAAGYSEKIAKGSSEVEKRKNRRVEVLSPKAIVRTLSATPDPKY